MKTILITGASGGFGRNVALALAQAGWSVFASMRDTTKGAELMEEAERGGCAGRVSLVDLDVTDSGGVDRAVAEILQETDGRLDALLNNAGYGVVGAFEDLSEADCRRQLETNFFGTLAVTRAVLPAMRKAGRGRIVVVTSNAVNSPHPMLSLYAASKWALEGWAEGLAMEVAPFGVQVAVVQPGAHRTPFAQHVVPVLPAGSPYGRWMEAVAPGIRKLDEWGREPQLATAALVAAISEPGTPFRTAIGEDTRVFSALKAAFPYEARAWLARAIVGAPAADSFTEAGCAPAPAGTGSAVARQLGEMLLKEPALAADMVQAFVARGARAG